MGNHRNSYKQSHVIRCHRCGRIIPDEGECERAHELYADLLESAEEASADERAEVLHIHDDLTQRHKDLLCHCLDRPSSLFSSQPQPENLDWHDKHDR